MNHTKTQSHSIRIPIRLSQSNNPDGISKVSSLSLKKNICALWLLLLDVQEGKDGKERITDFVYDCIDKWENDSAKGLSEFISEKMICEMLQTDDYKEYRKIKRALP